MGTAYSKGYLKKYQETFAAEWGLETSKAFFQNLCWETASTETSPTRRPGTFPAGVRSLGTCGSPALLALYNFSFSVGGGVSNFPSFSNNNYARISTISNAQYMCQSILLPLISFSLNLMTSTHSMNVNPPHAAKAIIFYSNSSSSSSLLEYHTPPGRYSSPMDSTASSRLQQEEKAEYGTSIMQEGTTILEPHNFDKAPMDVELRDYRFHQALLAEWFGTTAFVFFLVLSIMTANADTVRIALVAGFTFFSIVYMLASVSGAHFNPAVTLGVWAARRITTLRFICYIIFQLLGGLTGAALARSVSTKMFRNVNGGANSVATGISKGSAFWVELLGTLFLVMAVLAALDTNINSRGTLAPLEVALTIFLLHVVLLPFTGCSVNPARSFGTAVVGRYWHLHWIWWVAPLVGGLFAALLYSIIFSFGQSPKEELSHEGVLEGGRGGLGGFLGRGRGERQTGTADRPLTTSG